MIYSVDFLELTEQINPLAFVKYLKDTGWNSFQIMRKNIRVFQKEMGGAFHQITLPMDKQLSDYKEAMYRAVKTVSEVECRSFEQIMLYLLNPNTDILKIRLDKKQIETGSITFDDAIRMYENTKKLLAATALDILHPKKYHQGRIDDTVLNFLSNCRFGQTEIGSYVISVVCPFAQFSEEEGYKQLSIFSDEEDCQKSLTRKVTNRVINNLVLIKNHIDEGEEQLLAEPSDQIISANFYEALVGLNLDSKDSNIEIIAEWSPTVKNKESKTNRVSLTHDYYQPIVETIRKLKEQTSKSTKIIGRIKKLESSPDVKKRTTGKITVVYLDENEKPRTVTSELEKVDYDKAIEAHERGAHIEIVGELSAGKKASIKCESFGIIE